MSESEKKKILFKESVHYARIVGSNFSNNQVYFQPNYKGLFTIRAIKGNRLIRSYYCEFYDDAKITTDTGEITLVELNESIPLVEENIDRFLTIDEYTNFLRLKKKYLI